MKTHVRISAEKAPIANCGFIFLCALCVLCGENSCSEVRGQAKGDVNQLRETVREINDRVNRQLESLQTLYKYIHTHPELSL